MNKKIGTPTKKVKPNESGDDVSEFQIPLNNLVFIRNISNFDQSDHFIINCKNESKN